MFFLSFDVRQEEFFAHEWRSPALSTASFRVHHPFSTLISLTLISLSNTGLPIFHGISRLEEENISLTGLVCSRSNGLLVRANFSPSILTSFGNAAACHGLGKKSIKRIQNGLIATSTFPQNTNKKGIVLDDEWKMKLNIFSFFHPKYQTKPKKKSSLCYCQTENCIDFCNHGDYVLYTSLHF